MLRIITYALLAGSLYYDLRERRIPNFLTLTGIVVGLVLQAVLNGREGLLASFLGLGLGLLVLFPLFAVSKFGAGDVKLLAAIGALRGLQFLWRAALLGAVSGGVMAVLALAYHRELSHVTLGIITGVLYRTQRTYPYSPAIALGVLLADLGWLL
ncbi:MAG: prepilin peptidase CpaA [Bacillota bacterium]|nr:MAG: prepilin peptidase CpaA [Bacillota bacterium]